MNGCRYGKEAERARIAVLQWLEGKFPEGWKLAPIAPIFKVVQEMTGQIIGLYQFFLLYLDYSRS